MRRFIALCLLVLLPLECSWAAVASYCAHESQGQHFGHHLSNDINLADDTASVTPDAVPALDLDCGHGHGHCTGLISLAVELPAALAAAPLRAAVPDQGSPPAAARPERPQWARLA